FSPVGTRKDADPRNGLLFDLLRLISDIEPKFFLMENVPSLLSSDHYASFTKELSGRYALHAQVLNAAEYGVRQLRRRAVVIGFLKALACEPSLPKPTHGGVGKVFDYLSGKYVLPSTPQG